MRLLPSDVTETINVVVSTGSVEEDAEEDFLDTEIPSSGETSLLTLKNMLLYVLY